MGLIGKYFGIIGIVVAAIIIAVVKVLGQDKATGAMKRILTAARTGGPGAARAEIDKIWKPAVRPDRPYAPRLCALALAGDRERLEREVSFIDGKLRVVCYPKTWGLLGLVLAGDPTAPQKLAEHVAQCERELPGVMKKIKEAIRDIGVIGAALAGGSSEPMRKVRAGLFPFHSEWSRALVWECVARAFERDGKLEEAKNTRERNGVFERAKAA
jgi:hypothetical protein